MQNTSRVVTNTDTVLDASTGVQLARAGGGGSSSDGGGSSGGSSSSGGSYSSGGEYGSVASISSGFSGFIILVVILGVVSIVWRMLKRKGLVGGKYVAPSNAKAQEHDELSRSRVEDVFYKFQDAWSRVDIDAMQPLLTEEYLKRMVLELTVLKNQKRANVMSNVKLSDCLFGDSFMDTDGAQRVVVAMHASATDKLIDTGTQGVLFQDESAFTEYWHFVRDGKAWRLHRISQGTEDEGRVESDIATFAEQHKFYFDPDFGWLMMPNHGVLFKKTNFGRSDINNHVIGYYRNKVVEFYTYIPDPVSHPQENYLIAQAILPIQYKDILVRRRHRWWFNNWPFGGPRGLRRIMLESGDFNRKFCLWAHPKDSVSSLELLSPNFMERIYALPFHVAIEIVGNVLYFYTKDRGTATNEHMLEMLSWAFDEMRM